MIIAAVVAGMMFPMAFTKWASVDLRDKTLILVIVQLVMFGMGIQMSLKDFSGLAQTGKGVAIGLLCHFSIMPLMGLLLTKVFHFEPEIAAGIILIGSCSSGLASNVMVYLARANLILSVIVTAMATLAAPFLTPLLMKLLAGTLIKIDFLSMMLEIVKIVIVPIFAALLYDYFKNSYNSTKKNCVCNFWCSNNLVVCCNLFGSSPIGRRAKLNSDDTFRVFCRCYHCWCIVIIIYKIFFKAG
ncbi:MAG: bile acid:sodium symporter [Ferruginibacter sp.]